MLPKVTLCANSSFTGNMKSVDGHRIEECFPFYKLLFAPTPWRGWRPNSIGSRSHCDEPFKQSWKMFPGQFLSIGFIVGHSKVLLVAKGLHSFHLLETKL